MSSSYFENKKFENLNFKENPLPKGEYEDCIFETFNFEYADLSDFRFSNCIFRNCNLSIVNLTNTAFRDVKFEVCKMIGLQFNDCNQFGISVGFEECILNNSSFFECSIKRTVFNNCKLIEVDFERADVSNSTLKNCDLSGSVFYETKMEFTDFRTSFNFDINPTHNQMKKAKFSRATIDGLLRTFEIEIDD